MTAPSARIWPILPLLLFAALASTVALSMAPTRDEALHLEYGKRIFLGQPERDQPLLNSKMPATALNAAPRIGALLLERIGILPDAAAALSELRAARFATIAAAVFLGWLLGRWATALYGPAARLAAGILFALSPNLLAHSSLVTTDLYVSLGYFATLYCLWRLVRQPSTRRAVTAALALALAQLTKSSSLFLFPIVVVAILPTMLLPAADGRDKRALRTALIRFAVCSVAFAVVAVNGAFLFQGTFTPLKDYEFNSVPFQSLQSTPVVSSIPLPLPTPFLTGLDMSRYTQEVGITFGRVYLLGERRDPREPDFQPFYSYYAVAYLFKEPLALQILLILGIIAIARRRSLEGFLANEWFLLAPVLVVFVMFSFFNSAQIGIRHVLPAFPFLLLIGSAAFFSWGVAGQRQRLVFAGLILYLAISVLSYFPHMIPYMNELVTNRRYAWKYLADSNLDWGQQTLVVRDFLARNPDVILSPDQPRTGRILISADRLVGVYRFPDYGWLRDNFEPVAQVGYGHFLFNVEQLPDSKQ